MPASGDLKRCTKCGEEKPPAAFSRDRSRNDGRAPWCKACVRRWQQENAEHLADYHLRWQQANRDMKRAQGGRYRERERQDPDYRERRARTGPPLPGAKASPNLRRIPPRHRMSEPAPSRDLARFPLSVSLTAPVAR
jgi:hypothetical protein